MLFMVLAHRLHTAATPQQRLPHAVHAALAPLHAGLTDESDSHTAVAQPSCRCKPLLTVPTPPAPSLRVPLRYTQRPHAAATQQRSCMLVWAGW